MERMLINATQRDELRVAIVRNNKLFDLDIEHLATAQKKSNIYKGQISSIEPSLGAVFVDYGSERHGFLPLKEIARDFFENQKDVAIDDVDMRRAFYIGQPIVVQVEKDERGNKGAALTTLISLAGSFLVLMPNNPRASGISRRIEGEERDQLRQKIDALNLPEGMGVIIRTAGMGKDQEELNFDLKNLLYYWEAIKSAAVAKTGTYLIHQESDIVIRAIRDHLRQNISEIIIDDQNTFERAQKHLSKLRPDAIEKLQFYNSSLPLFSQFQIEQQIEQAFQREVHLPSGGSLVIDHTEALVAIDINSARATKGGNIEETAYNTNLEAAEEIPRQLRIRDIGGLVVIDFIDMLSNSNQRAIENKIRSSLKFDRARIQVGKISRFGLLEMSRQRLSASLSRSTQISCPRCTGRGSIRSIESLSLSILRLLEEESVKAGSSQIQLQLPIDVATFLINEKGDVLSEIKQKHNTDIVIIPNHHLHSPHYSLRLAKDDHSKNTVSYKLAKIPKITESANRSRRKATLDDEPAINQFLSNTTLQAPKKKDREGLIKRIWDALFGAEEEQFKPTPKKRTPASNRNTRNRKAPAKRSATSSSRSRSNNSQSKSATGNKREDRNTTTRKARSDNRGRNQRTQENQGRSDNRGRNQRTQEDQGRSDSRGRNQRTQEDQGRSDQRQSAKRKPAKQNTRTKAHKPEDSTTETPNRQRSSSPKKPNKTTSDKNAAGESKQSQTTTEQTQSAQAANKVVDKTKEAIKSQPPQTTAEKPIEKTEAKPAQTAGVSAEKYVRKSEAQSTSKMQQIKTKRSPKSPADSHASINDTPEAPSKNTRTAPKIPAQSSNVESIPQIKEKVSLQQIKTKKKSAEKTTSEESK